MADHITTLLGLTDADIAAFRASPRNCCGRPHGSHLDERPCTAGHCVEFWCPCGTPDGTSYGPVDCPCKHSTEETGQ